VRTGSAVHGVELIGDGCQALEAFFQFLAGQRRTAAFALRPGTRIGEGLEESYPVPFSFPEALAGLCPVDLSKLWPGGNAVSDARVLLPEWSEVC